jgi:hypothetical protein
MSDNVVPFVAPTNPNPETPAVETPLLDQLAKVESEIAAFRATETPVLSIQDKLAIRNSQFKFIQLEKEFQSLQAKHQVLQQEQQQVFEAAFQNSAADVKAWVLNGETLEFAARPAEHAKNAALPQA